MTKETFNRAKYLQEQIDLMKLKQSKIKKLESREDDEDFNELKSLSYDLLDKAIQGYTIQFNDL